MDNMRCTKYVHIYIFIYMYIYIYIYIFYPDTQCVAFFFLFGGGFPSTNEKESPVFSHGRRGSGHRILPIPLVLFYLHGSGDGSMFPSLRLRLEHVTQTQSSDEPVG